MEKQVLSHRKTKTATKKCYFCKCEEGKPRKLGQFIVELQEVELKSGLKVLACQSCSVHQRKELKGGEKKKKSFLAKLIGFFS